MKCLIILFSIILMACANNEAVKSYGIPDTGNIATAYPVVLTQVDTACNRENDSLRTALFQAQFKVNKVRYYLKICLRNPSQDKFLKGWIKRAIQ